MDMLWFAPAAIAIVLALIALIFGVRPTALPRHKINTTLRNYDTIRDRSYAHIRDKD